MKHTLGLLERTILLEILSDGSNVFFNKGASSSSSDLLTPLHFVGELPIQILNGKDKITLIN